jgi:HPt (histidine-containing phosphotransfer) domain-containing protein
MPGAIDEQFFARLTASNDRFAGGVQEMLARLSAARAAFDPAMPSPGLAEELRAVLHTMAGSAATFGYRVLGQQARALEQRLGVLTVFEAVGEADWLAWLAELDVLVGWARRDPKAAYYTSDAGG